MKKERKCLFTARLKSIVLLSNLSGTSVKISPRKLNGPWTEGYALDLQTTGSTFLGYDAYGHPVFDTQRSDLRCATLSRSSRNIRSDHAAVFSAFHLAGKGVFVQKTAGAAVELESR